MRIRELNPDDVGEANLLDVAVVSVVPGHDGEVRGYLAAERDAHGLRVRDLVGRDVAAQLGLLLRAGQLGRCAGRGAAAGHRPGRDGSADEPGDRVRRDHVHVAAARGGPARGGGGAWLAGGGVAQARRAVDRDVVDEHAPWHAGRQRLVLEDGSVRVEAGGSGAVWLHARALGP